MSKPEEQDWMAAKRLPMYLKNRRRVVLEYKYQELPKKVLIWSDTDFAGCGRTRKSTSGGAVMLGSQCLKTYSQTQDTIPLSSGESEFYGIVKAATMGVGIKSLFGDLGSQIEVHVNTDSSTARSISSRRRARRVRRVEVRELWVREKVRRRELSIIKVIGEDNSADGLTKHVDRSRLEKYMSEYGSTLRDGRHELCPHLAVLISSFLFFAAMVRTSVYTSLEQLAWITY
jgi:hypothetical protein